MSTKQFYRRELPNTCISFYSAEGKAIFKEALATDNMECYFKLASQFRTQDEPAFCGLTSLVIVLNALDVDPGLVWKGPWRWYHEKMLNCCKPLDEIEKDGITFDVFGCLASCNYLDVRQTRIGENQELGLKQFRETVIHTTKSDRAFVIVSYSRKCLQQTGDGHFSPIGGYHPGKDLVLILDTARFKYPPHWVPVPLLYEAMSAVDNSTGLPRGYVVLSRRNDVQDLLLFRLSDSINALCQSTFPTEITAFINNWEEWLSSENCLDVEKNEVINKAIDRVVSLSKCFKADYSIFQKQDNITCPTDVQKQLDCSLDALMKQLEGTQVYLYANLCAFSSTLFGKEITFDIECDTMRRLTLNTSDFATVFILSWPYSSYIHVSNATNAFKLHSTVESILQTAGNECLRMEMEVIETQIANILRVSKSGCC